MGLLNNEIHSIAQTSFINEEKLESLLITAWENAVNQVLDDNVLTKKEEEALVLFRDHFTLSQDELDRNGAYSKLVKGAVIRDLLEGKLPQRVTIEGSLPFNFQKSETIVWVFQNVDYLEQRTRRRYVGGSSGVNVRFARGVYYRVGNFRGNPIDVQESVFVDTGILAITDKHIYFAGDVRAFKIAHAKIISFTPYSDGIGIQRDALTSKPQSFVTDDGWFTYNLLSTLAKMRAT